MSWCGSRESGLEADHYWFGFEVDVPDFLYALLDLFFESEDIGGGGCAAVDDCEGVAARDADAPEAESFGEAGALDQPGCGDFLARCEGGVAGEGQSTGCGALFEVLGLFFGEHWILKKRSSALTVRVSVDDEHAFERANVAHGFASFGEIGTSFAAFEVALEIGISNASVAARSKRVGNAENDEASALGLVKDAGAVAEATGFGAEFADLIIF